MISKISLPLDESESLVKSLIHEKYKSHAWKPNTCRVYINSTIKFIKYLMKTRQECYSLQRLQSFLESLRSLSTALQNIAIKVKKTMLKSSSVVDEANINPDDLKVYIESPRLQQGQALLKNLGEKNQTNHTMARNYIMMMLVISNPHRTGVIMNMTDRNVCCKKVK